MRPSFLLLPAFFGLLVGCRDQDINVHNDTPQVVIIGIDLGDGLVYDTVALQPDADMVVRDGRNKLKAIYISGGHGRKATCSGISLKKAIYLHSNRGSRDVVSVSGCFGKAV